ncbi:DUF1684 domain-containing protein [uncultured Chryseobacterium sp.]|uniref:DUF1684 domain-containing protein n=1 Tax=uncultured Chryseobacterium sp. TaxID=259322 RepID=UPI0025E7D1A4|nr:DUF1684 domain-containing protein [uncultured Chryseobacterium sp.]
MKKYFFLFLLFPLVFSSQKTSKEESEIKKFQKELNAEYRNPKETPLRGDNFTDFKEHPFFPVDMKYRVTANFVKTENAKPFDLPTSSGKTKAYREYGKASFTLDGQPYTLTLYQSLDLIKQEKYRDYLFLPFRDATNGKETYGGGKYMDLTIPKGNTIILDFNKSYQPYCAYNAYDYNCPVVPEENRLPVEIRAGVMYKNIYHH